MRVLVADEFSDLHIRELEAHGFDVDYDPRCSADDLASEGRIGEADILIVRSTRVTRAAIDGARRLALVVRAGAGVDTIDVDAASDRGIRVSNCPGKNAAAVAELAMGLILALDRRIPDATFDLRAGRWNKKEYSQADGLKGKALGIVGLGRVGSELAKRARAFEMRVAAWSVPLRPERVDSLRIGAYANLEDLVEQSDVVSVHLPQAAATRRLFDAAVFARMKPHTIFVNTSRGAIVDEADLVAAMQEKHLRVGLDVFDPEPAEGVAAFRPALVDAGSFVGTPHIGASTAQSQNAIAAEAVRICLEFSKTGAAPNTVNIEENAPAECQLVVRHYDRVGVLASVLAVLRTHGVNVEEMSNAIFRGAKTAVATIRLSKAPGPVVVAEITALKDAVISAEVKRV
ncbi:MAG: NAD(P)-dependent oxidoreductase [Polyangiaceae bacterium]